MMRILCPLPLSHSEEAVQDRNVDQNDEVAPLPTEVKDVITQMKSRSVVGDIDQITVNEYPPGVGLAPHIDTHSAFTGEYYRITTSPDRLRNPGSILKVLLFSKDHRT